MFKEINMNTLKTNVELARVFKFACFSTTKRGDGTFVSFRPGTKLPTSTKDFGIVLPKGGMIIPDCLPEYLQSLINNLIEEEEVVRQAAKAAKAAGRVKEVARFVSRIESWLHENGLRETKVKVEVDNSLCLIGGIYNIMRSVTKSDSVPSSALSSDAELIKWLECRSKFLLNGERLVEFLHTELPRLEIFREVGEKYPGIWISSQLQIYECSYPATFIETIEHGRQEFFSFGYHNEINVSKVKIEDFAAILKRAAHWPVCRLNNEQIIKNICQEIYDLGPTIVTDGEGYPKDRPERDVLLPRFRDGYFEFNYKKFRYDEIGLFALRQEIQRIIDESERKKEWLRSLSCDVKYKSHWVEPGGNRWSGFSVTNWCLEDGTRLSTSQARFLEEHRRD